MNHLKTIGVMLLIVLVLVWLTLAMAEVDWAVYSLCAAIILAVLSGWYYAIYDGFKRSARRKARR